MKRLWVMLGVMLSLTGCKLVIVAPEGARVVSSSGLYTCEAGVRCEININHTNFLETFTTEPKSGYRFVQWRQGNGYFCGGGSQQKEASCNLSTRGFPGNPGLMSILRGNDTFYLVPQVVADGTVPLSHIRYRQKQNARFEVHHYQVRGTTRDEIAASIDEGKTAIPPMTCGSGVVGWAYSTFEITYRTSSVPGRNGYCSLEEVNVWTTHDVNMPNLVTPPARLDEGLQIRWDNFYTALQDHEAGHVSITRDAVTELKRRLQNLGPMRCGEVKARINTLLARIDAEIDRRNRDFDVETNNGIFTGAVW